MATEEHAGGLQIHPMDQFMVKPLFGDGPEGGLAFYTVTNVTLWMAIAVALRSCALGASAPAAGRSCPRAVQSVAELVYGFVHKMIEDVAGQEGLKFFPYVMTLFMFIVLPTCCR